MPRLIDADELFYKLTVTDPDASLEFSDGVAKAMAFILKAPTIEAEPVKHGKWLWDGKHYYCSVCSGTRYHDLVLGMDAVYCPYCGAKLGGVEDGKK